MHSFTGELSTRTKTRISLESDHDLVHQSFIVFTTEHGFVDINGLALFVQEIEVPLFRSLRLNSRTDDHFTALGAGKSTANQQKLTFSVNARNDEVLRRALHIAQMTGHACRENAARV